jgi:hypothetical protein
MNSNFCPSFNVKNSPTFQGLFQRLFPEQELDMRRFWCTAIISLGVGMAIGTSLAIALDIPPMLGICNALHLLQSK